MQKELEDFEVLLAKVFFTKGCPQRLRQASVGHDQLDGSETPCLTCQKGKRISSKKAKA